ncbi:MAG: YggS family pyridoxal phosphate-dependent enzyme [Candidatus Omnitrophota bacterium]|nr:YggS family pyridoxal phosphate-dependent enzyme [Candidatus Omnitrophota bacterium]MDZ4241891.1 YggS family pyridoxal phosphate-dependent enzyme [Candidatus Omnitrophota bacterium]
MIQDRISQLRGRIAEICRKANRDPKEITVIGVTKYTTVDKMKEAVSCGITDLGENRVQDAQGKFALLDQARLKYTKHLIGHLQSNKAKLAVPFFDVIQSVDSLPLAHEIDRQAERLNKETVNILVQINTSGEAQKSGVAKADALKLMDELVKLKRIQILGLMTMAPLTEDKSVVRQTFRDLRLVRDQVDELFKGNPKVRMQHLSMGMSQDFEIAIQEGSNMVRIGTAIFGE